MTAKSWLQTASIACLAMWALTWLLFLLLRLSSFDIRRIPGIGPVMLVALAVALLAPVMATGFAIAALVRQHRVPLNWVMFACASAAVFGTAALFLVSRWL
jgi:hypothetical protein